MSECPIVEISLGKAKGKSLGKVKGGNNVFLYSSLPFAKPPVGDLRFEPPVSPEPWDGVLDARKHSAAPVQDRTSLDAMTPFMPRFTDQEPEIFDEDCLYLSVYTSKPHQAANFPVLVWLYGGGFTIGGEYFYDARVLASLYDVVVVIPNYRVAVFGFLCLGRETNYPGNMGLHDQTMALKWTQNHIKAFGGNPEKVTLFGQSAGAGAVGYHIVSPLSRGLFHHAISHSGTFYTIGFPLDDADKPLKAFLEQLKIEETDPKLVIKKLKSLTREEIYNANKAMGETFNYFAPVYDGKFFPKAMSIMQKVNVANNVPYIVGCNNTEGLGIMVATYPENFNSGITKESYFASLKGFVGSAICPGLPDSAYDVLTKEYEKDKKDDDPMKWSKMYGEILGDLIFVGPTIQALKQHVASEGKSYMYVMTQQLQFNHKGPENARKAECCKCDHGDDLVFTFGMPLTDQKFVVDPNFTEDEKKLCREWMNYIVNFANNGDPNIGLPVKVKWPEYNAKTRKNLFVQEPCSTGANFGVETNDYWRDVIEPMKESSNQTQKS